MIMVIRCLQTSYNELCVDELEVLADGEVSVVCVVLVAWVEVLFLVVAVGGEAMLRALRGQ